MQQNPFSYTFGLKPKEYIPNEQEDDILENFLYDEPTERAYMITGVRGCGKTVMLSDISESLERQGDWIIADLNPARDLMQSLAAQLYELKFMKVYFLNAKIDLSFFGIGIEIDGGERITDIETAIDKMLSEAARQKKKVLVTIDEAASSNEMQIFCLAFQRFIRKRLPIYIIMTGLYNRIHNIKNMKNCTFLQRAPYITLQPLDLSAIALKYKKVFGIERKKAIEMAQLTMGYAFAFQVLGKLYFDYLNGTKSDKLSEDAGRKDSATEEDLILEYESELIRYSYRKIWSELSGKDRQFVLAMTEINNGENITKQALMEKTGFSSAMVNRYQGRLKEQGIIYTPIAGTYSFSLPRFAQFLQEYYIG